jgi:hypothetical protein
MKRIMNRMGVAPKERHYDDHMSLLVGFLRSNPEERTLLRPFAGKSYGRENELCYSHIEVSRICHSRMEVLSTIGIGIHINARTIICTSLVYPFLLFSAHLREHDCIPALHAPSMNSDLLQKKKKIPLFFSSLQNFQNCCQLQRDTPMASGKRQAATARLIIRSLSV